MHSSSAPPLSAAASSREPRAASCAPPVTHRRRLWPPPLPPPATRNRLELPRTASSSSSPSSSSFPSRQLTSHAHPRSCLLPSSTSPSAIHVVRLTNTRAASLHYHPPSTKNTPVHRHTRAIHLANALPPTVGTNLGSLSASLSSHTRSALAPLSPSTPPVLFFILDLLSPSRTPSSRTATTLDRNQCSPSTLLRARSYLSPVPASPPSSPPSIAKHAPSTAQRSRFHRRHGVLRSHAHPETRDRHVRRLRCRPSPHRRRRPARSPHKRARGFAARHAHALILGGRTTHSTRCLATTPSQSQRSLARQASHQQLRTRAARWPSRRILSHIRFRHHKAAARLALHASHQRRAALSPGHQPGRTSQHCRFPRRPSDDLGSSQSSTFRTTAHPASARSVSIRSLASLGLSSSHATEAGPARCLLPFLGRAIAHAQLDLHRSILPARCRSTPLHDGQQSQQHR